MRSWARFVGWAATAALLAVGTVDGAGGGPGLFLLPAGVVILALLLRTQVWPEVLGGVAGVGVLCLLVAYFNRHTAPCPSGACAGVAPGPWLISGAVLVACGFATFIVFRGRASTV